MAFKFNAILKFNSDQATRGLDRAGKSFNQLTSNIKKADESLSKINQGLQGAALAGAPLTAGVAFATKTFADFEFQMKTVQSVMLATDAEMVDLNNTAKLLGATTEFSAKQAGEGAESLARAGFNVQQTIGALPGVLAAASAGGVDLATATDIVVGQLGAFGLEASKAGEVADQLALTTALTNTDFIQLGEAMKFAAPIAKASGLALSETASAMGVLANAGVKGSLAGTALKNALLQLSKPSQKALELFGGKDGLNKAVLETVNVNGKLITRLKPMEVIMANVSKVVASAKDPLEATAAASEIFGLRGTTAFSSFQAALTKTVPITDKNREAIVKGAKAVGENIDEYIKEGAIPQLVALRLNIAGAAGTAQKMRDIKLNSLTGQVVLLQSAFEGINIELGGVFAGVTRELVVNATDFLSVLTVGFQAANAGGKATEAQIESLKNNQFKEMIPMMIEFAQGFIQGFNEIKESAVETFNTVAAFLKPVLGDVGMTTKEFGSLVAKIVTVGAVAAPILGALAAGFFVLGPIITGISGTVGLITSAFGILWSTGGVILGLLGTAFSVLTSPITLTIGAIAGVGLAIAGIWKNWENVKTAFLDGRILDGFKAIGNGIMMFLDKPLGFVAQKWEGIKSFFGFGGDKTAPTTGKSAIQDSSSVNAIKESAQIQQESVKQKGLVQPASQEQIAQAVTVANQGANTGGGSSSGGTTTQKIELSFKGDAKKVFNKMVTESQVENASLKGRTPANKRKLLQNGAALVGGF